MTQALFAADEQLLHLLRPLTGCSISSQLLHCGLQEWIVLIGRVTILEWFGEDVLLSDANHVLVAIGLTKRTM